ncbi:hypothetical protein BUE76_09725 [Cnuella takakiae]|nr:hypothetical protein BUE76_09725 [Cnuella takakiae]
MKKPERKIYAIDAGNVYVNNYPYAGAAIQTTSCLFDQKPGSLLKPGNAVGNTLFSAKPPCQVAAICYLFYVHVKVFTQKRQHPCAALNTALC